MALNQEKEWLARSLEGDLQSFEPLIHRYQKMIFALAYRMTGSAAEAEDLAQETFIHAFRKLGTFRSEASFSSWLYRIAVNRCLNWKKSHVSQTELHQAWVDHQEKSQGEEVSHVSEQVQRALLQLNPEQRASIILTTFEEMNHAQAAEALGCSEATISWRIFMGRKKLKGLLQKQMASGFGVEENQIAMTGGKS